MATPKRASPLGFLGKRPKRDPAEPTEVVQPRPVVPPAATTTALSLRDEKILLTLVVQTQQLNDRLTRLEDRFDASERDAQAQPDQQDLLELRMHSARLGAELSRVTVELRAEINEIAAGITGATGADDIAPPGLTDDPASPTAGSTDDETDAAEHPVVDLRDPPAPQPRPYRSSGWRPASVPDSPNDRRSS